MTERHEALKGELEHAREQTDSLFRLISPGALYERPIAERHRLIFYKGHFEAFDWNLLARRGMSEKAFHSEFDKLFERGIDPAPGEAPADTVCDWPSLSEVDRYSNSTREWVERHLEEIDPVLLQMAIEHRYMHAETFAYLMHNLPYSDKQSCPPQRAKRRPAPANPIVKMDGGIVALGKPADGCFGWDNEYLAHEVEILTFGMSKYKVSNGEYLEFVKAGGPAPNFWTRVGREWFYRGMFAQIPLPLDWPVWVTWHQADAFAKWRGLALPSEAQFQLAADRITSDPASDNFDFRRWDPVPVDNATDTSVGTLVGNGWEWTRDIFGPFDGFEAHPFYPGYSADFFDGQHYVMKGASPRTARLLTRPSFRNWFRPEYPYMYAGFRLVENS